jgi:predicted DNA-binding protein (MmcQ/YjbR family)
LLLLAWRHDGWHSARVTLDGYNNFCRSLHHTAHVVQWGDAHVWKVGGPKGKVFAIASRWEGPSLDITFKASQMSFDLLKEAPGMRPAPYLASRGLLWLQRRTAETLDDAALKDYLRESHRLAALNLSKRLQKELGLA